MNAYRINQVRLHWGQMPVKFISSLGTVDHFPFLLVRLSTNEAQGVGEALVPPNDFIHHFLPSLLGCDVRRLDKLLPPVNSDHDRILCEAVSMALYDVVGRISGLPLYALLGGCGSEVVPLMPCIFPSNAEEAREKAALFCGMGYRFLKTKLVGDLAEDKARVQAIRSIIPKGVVLQGDANEGYKTLEEAARAVAELGAVGLDIFEDPLKGSVADYRSLTAQRADARVMVDALARRTDDLLSVLKAGAADVIGIHPDQPGSMSRVLHHARLSETFGVPFVIGGTGYTAVGSAAYQHLAAVAKPGGPCGELGGFFDHGMPCTLIKTPLPTQNGSVILPDRVGTGVELDEDALARYQISHQEWRG